MNESPRTSSAPRSRKWLLVWALMGVVLAFALGIEGFVILRAWKRGTLLESARPAKSNEITRVESQEAEPAIEPAIPAENPVPPRPRTPARIPNDNFTERFSLDTPAH